MPAQTKITQLRGLAFPATRAIGGYFGEKTRYDVAWGDLLLTMFTPIGTRPGRRDFGSALHLLLQEPNINGNQQIVEHTVRVAAQRWCPHVVVYGVIARAKVSDSNVIQIGIRFGLADEQVEQSRLVEVNRDAVVLLTAGA